MKNSFINNLLENFASKTVIALLTIIGGAITIYAFLQEKKADLRYEIISNTNVLDFNAEISKLDVIYDSTNLKRTNENLRIYTIKIVNNGNQNILKEYYDENDPIGLRLSSGKIIEQPEIIQASNEYLKKNTKVSEYQYEDLKFSGVIIESGEFFIIKFLVLHKKETIPTISSFGKIAGQKKINIVNSVDVKEELPFLEKVFYGNIWTQLLRLISYFLFATIIIIIVVAIASWFDDIKERKRKNKNIEDFKSVNSYQYTRMDDAIFDRYKNNGGWSFDTMIRLVENEKQLNFTFEKLSNKLKNKRSERKNSFEYHGVTDDNDEWTIINEMTKDGIVFWDKNKLTVNQAMKDTLVKFVEFLEQKNDFKSRYRIYDEITDEITEEDDLLN